jgi:hypothetical protein
MNTEKIYKDSENNQRTISQMVKLEPEWAASRIQAGENALELIKQIKKYDIAQFTETGKFKLSFELREKIEQLTE